MEFILLNEILILFFLTNGFKCLFDIYTQDPSLDLSSRLNYFTYLSWCEFFKNRTAVSINGLYTTNIK